MIPLAGSAAGWLLPRAIAQTAFAAAPPRLRGWLSREICSLRGRRMLAQARARVPAVLATLPPDSEAPTWRVHRAEWTESDLAVIGVGPAGGPRVIVKLARSSVGAAGLQRQSAVLAALRADPALGAWRSYLPTLLARGEVDGQPYSVEGALPGRDMRRLLTQAPRRASMALFFAATAIAELHRRTLR
ncbi:MAG TPA: hypothetical protein VGL23_13475, partial [Chloroflexota bacterium]